MKRLYLYIILLLIFLSTSAWGATYTAYFADDGTDDIVGTWDDTECTEGDPCNTLTEAQKVVDDLTSDDTVTLYFARGDTWTIDTGQNNILTVDSSDPIVNIDAYGSGDRPIFDGEISDFTTVTESGTDGYYFYRLVFLFERNNCSIKNIEIKRIYGTAIRLGIKRGRRTRIWLRGLVGGIVKGIQDLRLN